MITEIRTKLMFADDLKSFRSVNNGVECYLLQSDLNTHYESRINNNSTLK